MFYQANYGVLNDTFVKQINTWKTLCQCEVLFLRTLRTKNISQYLILEGKKPLKALQVLPAEVGTGSNVPVFTDGS